MLLLSVVAAAALWCLSMLSLGLSSLKKRKLVSLCSLIRPSHYFFALLSFFSTNKSGPTSTGRRTVSCTSVPGYYRSWYKHWMPIYLVEQGSGWWESFLALWLSDSRLAMVMVAPCLKSRRRWLVGRAMYQKPTTRPMKTKVILEGVSKSAPSKRKHACTPSRWWRDWGELTPWISTVPMDIDLPVGWCDWVPASTIGSSRSAFVVARSGPIYFTIRFHEVYTVFDLWRVVVIACSDMTAL